MVLKHPPHGLGVGLPRRLLGGVNPVVMTTPHDLDEKRSELALQSGLVGPAGPELVMAVLEAPLILAERTDGAVRTHSNHLYSLVVLIVKVAQTKTAPNWSGLILFRNFCFA